MEIKNSTPKIGRFETNRLLLRHVSIDDADQIQKILTKRVCESIPEISYPVNVINMINEKLQAEYMAHVIILKKINEIIGFIQMSIGSINSENDYVIEVGYWIGEDYWDNGYCSEVLKIITNIIEANNWTQKVIALVYDGNKSSENVLLKSGFVNPKNRITTKCGEANLFVYESQHYKNNVRNNPE